jgi:hypothetical protein
MANSTEDGQRGSASVEQVGLAALIAAILVAAIAGVAAGGEIEGGRDLGGLLARRIACAPRLPDACRHHPLVPAYGWPLARLVRALAPAPAALPAEDGLPLVPVDFRRCRSESCAVAAGPHLSASGMRTTAFTEIEDHRRDLGWVCRGSESRAERLRPTWKQRPILRSYSRTIRPSFPWRRSPAATTTTSRWASGHRGSGS